MYNFIRKIHLYAGLIILIFLMMYFISGFMMVHRPWFVAASPPPTTQTAPLQSSDPLPPEQLAANVKKQLSLAGRIQFPQTQPPGMTRFWVVRPGTMIRVDIPTKEHQIHLSTQRVGLVGILIMLHKVSGSDDQLLFDVYAFFCDLAGLSMILFAVSGVYLWWKRVKNHTLGIVCLTASCAYAAGMMLYFAYAP
ncbi:MAG TPA: PepSY-associated TM helix domain-containing protein [Tepidisphaeraceae bacterium]|jgi:hypothetical protein